MTSKEKAKDLIAQFMDENYFTEKAIIENSKENSFIAVNQIIDDLKERTLFWEDVIIELKKI